MRVIAGERKGHNLKTPEGLSTRPTSDKVKGSLFSMLQDFVYGKKVLDLFAGSGALGIEALSRGAHSCIFLDTDFKARQCIKDNLIHTKFTNNGEILNSDSITYLKTCSATFDLIFIDPPYNKGLSAKALEIISERKLLNPGGFISVETDETEPPLPDYDGLLCVKSKQYGRISLKIYKNSIDYL
jgi:16S rRNA (guanine(966)-N(2))-methyltransferase RsmD